LIIATKNLIGHQGDIIKQDVYATLQQKIELDQQDIDILVCDFKITPGYRGSKHEIKLIINLLCLRARQVRRSAL